MEYSIDAVSKRMILVIAILSVLIAVGGGIFHFTHSDIHEIVPFALGVAIAMCVNIIKVLWLKRTVENSVNMEARSAQLHLQGQYFIRLVLTGGALLAVVFIPDEIVSLWGAIFGIFTLPIASYSIQFFLKGQMSDIITNPVGAVSVNSANDAINEINAIVAEKEAETLAEQDEQNQ